VSFYDQQTWAGNAGGTANAIILSVPDITTTSDLLGVIINFKVSATNTGPVTVSVGGTAAQPLLKMTLLGLMPLVGNELIATGTPNTASILSNGTSYIMIAPSFLPGISSSTNLQVFTSSGTYTPTVGKLSALVFASGGGGSAGCSGSVNNAGGGWGGGTAIAYIPLSGIASIPITIGFGGGAQTTATISGFPGGTTSVGTYAVATGGPGGWGPSAGTLPSVPGVGTTGTLLLAGNAGQLPTGGNQGGNGGGSFWGGAGSAGTNIPSGPSSAPTAGVFGGGGGAGPAPGGPGSPGKQGGGGIVLILELT
jgi:hypothetical protein